MQEVYEKKEGDIDINYVLASFPSDAERTFIRKQHIVAKKLYYYIPDKKYAELIRDLIMTETKDIAILYRNKKDNPFLMGILKALAGGGEEIQIKEPEQKGITGKIKKLISSEKKIKKEEKED